MKKTFNTTGNCYAHIHYMMDNRSKIDKAYELIERGHYFTINRPRQYGKTTLLFALEERLRQSETYFPIRLNFQGIDQKWHESDSAFAKMFVRAMVRYCKFIESDFSQFLAQKAQKVEDMDLLSELITDLVYFSKKKLVLLVDEVDASSNYMPFLSFLGMLRTKYLARFSPEHFTFHSVVLVGVHDIKSLKYKIRNPEEAQYNSPWNIAVDFESEMEFNPQEIAPMLVEYCEAEKIEMDIPKIAEKLYFYTAGYPFLVSRLCQIVAEKILPKKEKTNEWLNEDIDTAVQLIENENNTNFESLTKNLANHQDLYELVCEILLEGQKITFNIHQTNIHKGILYGLFKQNGIVKIHNPIYEQIIYGFLISNTRKKIQPNVVENRFLENESLNFPFILQRFQAYMKEYYATKDLPFLEREWRLIFLAFLKPIINGKGYTFIEPEISEERRLDVAVTFGKNNYVVELKIWRGQEYQERGLKQLAGYLDKQGLDTGFLVIFDRRREMVWQEEWIDFEGKRIFAVWV